MVNNEWLIKLSDGDTEEMIVAYYTTNPEQFLATFQYCKNHNIPINIPHKDSDEYYKYNNKDFGDIYEIEVHFGGYDFIPCIEVWLEDII